MSFTPAFQRVVTECNVPASFQTWMLANKITDAHFFLLGAPHGVDRDLIEPCGIDSNVAERIAIRYAFRVCKIGSEDEERARIAAAASPGSADIPTETLVDLFQRRHAFVLPSKRLLNDLLVKELYHGYHKRPKQLKFYLPRQLQVTIRRRSPSVRALPSSVKGYLQLQLCRPRTPSTTSISSNFYGLTSTVCPIFPSPIRTGFLSTLVRNSLTRCLNG